MFIIVISPVWLIILLLFVCYPLRVFIISNRPIWPERVSAKQGAGVTKMRKAPWTPLEWLSSLLSPPFVHSSFIKTSAQQLIIIFRIDQSKATKRKFYDQNAQSGVDDEETSKRKRRQPCPISSCDPQGAEGEGGERAVDGTTLSEGENATARTTTTMPISPPPQQGNSRVSGATSMTKTRTFNDNSHSFKRRGSSGLGNLEANIASAARVAEQVADMRAS